MNRQVKVENIADGTRVAEIIIGLYCNTFDYTAKNVEFVKAMLVGDETAQYNFTVLCLEWFRALAKVEYYDSRNEHAVMLAREISRSTDKTFTYRDFPRDGIAETFDIVYTSSTEIVKMVVDYIKISKGDYADFVKKAVYEHKTLQQSFNRLSIKWFDIYAQVNYSSKDDVVIAVRKILTFDTSLPFI